MDNTKYTGTTSLHLTEDETNELYHTHNLSGYDFIENQYVSIIDDSGEVIDKLCYQNGKLRFVDLRSISNAFTGVYRPRNVEQYFAFDMLHDRTSTIKLLTGKFGTGKTLLLVTAALEALEKGEFSKIVWIRNNIQVSNTDPIGALPGTEFEKMLPYLGPMVDHVGGMEGIQKLINTEQLEVIPLGFIRGRSIRDAIVIVTEAENVTKEHLKLLISRVDEHSNIWFDADVQQRDKRVFTLSEGIESMIAGLKGDKLFSYVNLAKCERSETAALADKIL